MFTLLTTLLSFLAGNTPKFLEFFQDRSDKKHEIELAQLQMMQQLELQKAGFVAQKDLEEIKFNEIKISGDLKHYETKIADVASARANDTADAIRASQRVNDIRALVRPAITFGLFFIFLAIEVFGCWYAYYNSVDYKTAISLLWSDETKIVWASIIGFYFGTR